MRWQPAGRRQCLLQPVFRLFLSVVHVIDGPGVALLFFNSICPPLGVGGLKLFIFPSESFSLSSDSIGSRSQLSDLLLVSQSGWVAGLG